MATIPTALRSRTRRSGLAMLLTAALAGAGLLLVLVVGQRPASAQEPPETGMVAEADARQPSAEEEDGAELAQEMTGGEVPGAPAEDGGGGADQTSTQPSLSHVKLEDQPTVAEPPEEEQSQPDAPDDRIDLARTGQGNLSQGPPPAPTGSLDLADPMDAVHVLQGNLSAPARPAPPQLPPVPSVPEAPRGDPDRPPEPPQVAFAVPPVPPGAPGLDASGETHLHAGIYGIERGTVAGLSARTTVVRPDVEGGMSLFEVAAVNNGDIVEVGWQVDPDRTGDDQPHLFVFHWVDGQPACYDACGFHQESSTVAPGIGLEEGSEHQFSIAHDIEDPLDDRDGKWWVGLDGEWFGFYRDKKWGNDFTAAKHLFWFGETATTSSEMGNGAFGHDPFSVAVTEILVGREDAAGEVYWDWPHGFDGLPPESPWYDVGAVDLDSSSFRYGGPGAR